MHAAGSRRATPVNFSRRKVDLSRPVPTRGSDPPDLVSGTGVTSERRPTLERHASPTAIPTPRAVATPRAIASPPALAAPRAIASPPALTAPTIITVATGTPDRPNLTVSRDRPWSGGSARQP